MRIKSAEIIVHVALIRDICASLVNQDEGAHQRMTAEEKKFKELEFRGLLTAAFSLLGGALCDMNRAADSLEILAGDIGRAADALEGISATLADMKASQDKAATEFLARA